MCNTQKGAYDMGEIKPVSFRINEEDQEKFKSFAAESGLNQADAFSSIISMMELDKAKSSLGSRAKAIDAFRDTTSKLINFYLNALEENETAEERIREELSKELTTKDNTISNLTEQLGKIKTNVNTLNEQIKELTDTKNTLSLQLNKADVDNADKQKTIDKLNSSNDLLQENLKEYREYKEINKNLEQQLKNHQQEIAEKDNKIADISNSNKQLQDKINNDAEMLNFYKDSITELKNSNMSLNDDIRALEKRNDESIEKLAEEHKKALEDELKALEDKLEAKHSIELQKKELVIEKLKNTIEQLQAKPKTSRKTKKEI